MYVKSVSREWSEHTTNWLTKYKGPLHIVSYERMKETFYEELFNLATFLGVNVTFRTVWCAGINREGSFHRVKPDWLIPSLVYSADLRNIIFSAIKTVSASLSKMSERIPFFANVNSTYIMTKTQI